MFKFGANSVQKLSTVRPILEKLANRALQASSVDFGVIDGMRSVERQYDIWKRGASKLNGVERGQQIFGQPGTGVSKHQEGKAIDCSPFVDGEYSDDWEHFYPMALAFQRAAAGLGIELVWGGVWDRKMSELSEDMKAEVQAYSQRRKALGRKAFLDGYHFELID